MVNESYEKTKHIFSFSKKNVEKAGRILRKDEGDKKWAIEVVQNYRSAHIYPLTIIKNLIWKHVQKVDPNATVVRRLKRLPTIINKLQRATLDGVQANAIDLRRMQDIGGVRVILENATDLMELDRRLDSSRTVHEVCRKSDYIQRPKLTGYRGIHRVYKAYEKKEFHDWKGFQIEVQIRTQLQHLWATAIEIVDLFENETLKTNPLNASADWKRFFFIMSEWLAIEDGLSNWSVIDWKKEYKEELNNLNTKLSAYEKFDSFSTAFSNEEIGKRTKENAYTLLIYDLQENKGRARFYKKSQQETAIDEYNKIDLNANVVGLLVEGADMKTIEKAYPNYLIDTKGFLTALSKALLT